MKPIRLLPLLLLVTSISFSQRKTVEGYYINATGDTILGQFPQYKQPEQNPDHVEFITAENHNITLIPQNCMSFGVTGYDSYVAYNGPRMINPIDDPWTDEKIEFPNRYDTIHSFLRIIYEGQAITLYSFQDKIRTNFFYKKPGSKMIELEKKSYSYDAESNWTTHTINRFRDQLKEEFTAQVEAKKLQPRLNSLGYTERDLVKFMDLLMGTDVTNQDKKSILRYFSLALAPHLVPSILPEIKVSQKHR